MTTGPSPICMGCKHYRPDAPQLACDAFPDVIPDSIIENRVDHREPVPGDGGIVFSPRSTVDAAYADRVFTPVTVGAAVGEAGATSWPTSYLDGFTGPPTWAYSPGQKRDTAGRFGSGGGKTGGGTAATGDDTAATGVGGPSQERLNEVGGALADPTNHGRDYETAAILDDSGKEILRVSQQAEASVDFTEDQMAQLRGAHILHNHPSGSDVSVLDAKLLITSGAASIHAYGTAPNSRGRLETVRSALYSPKNGWSRGRAGLSLDRAELEVRDHFTKTIADAGGDPDKTRAAIAFANHAHSGAVMSRWQEIHNSKWEDFGDVKAPDPDDQMRFEVGIW